MEPEALISVVRNTVTAALLLSLRSYRKTILRYVTLHLRFLLFRDTPKCASHVTVNTTDDVTLDVVATEVRRRARLPNYRIEFYSEEDRDTMPVRNVQLAATFTANAVI